MRKTSFNGLEKHLEKLRSFTTVARLGSFRAASSELLVSQPSLSRGIMTLEAVIKAKLFERSRNGVKLTFEGKLLLDFCDHLFGSIANLEKRLQHPGNAFAGVIHIGTFESLTFYLWPRLLKDMSKDSPALSVRLVSGNESELRAQLLAGKIQMVVEAEPRSDERVRSVILYRDIFHAYETPDLTRSTSHAIPPVIFVARARDQAGLSIREHLLSGGVPQDRLTYELDTFSSAQEFALAGLGAAILPKRLAHDRVRDGKLSPVHLASLPSLGFGEHRICASYLEENHTDPRIRLVLKRLRTFGTDR